MAAGRVSCVTEVYPRGLFPHGRARSPGPVSAFPTQGALRAVGPSLCLAWDFLTLGLRAVCLLPSGGKHPGFTWHRSRGLFLRNFSTSGIHTAGNT